MLHRNMTKKMQTSIQALNVFYKKSQEKKIFSLKVICIERSFEKCYCSCFSKLPKQTKKNNQMNKGSK